ncbi:hypothetical protein ACOMHN_009917 [Nucella lapillus]
MYKDEEEGALPCNETKGAQGSFCAKQPAKWDWATREASQEPALYFLTHSTSTPRREPNILQQSHEKHGSIPHHNMTLERVLWDVGDL